MQENMDKVRKRTPVWPCTKSSRNKSWT
jgi:hypothetical protein